MYRTSTPRRRWLLIPRSANFDIDVYLNPYLPPNPLPRIPKLVSRYLGYRDAPFEDVGSIWVTLWSAFGAFISLVMISAWVRYSGWVRDLDPPVLIGSLGAAAILDFNAVMSPLAQPRNSVLGNTLSSVIGIAFTKAFSLSTPTSLAADIHTSTRWLVGPLACAVASAAMTLTGTVHPPGGATALIAVIDLSACAMGWWFVLLTFLASLNMLITALLINNVMRRYPTWWWSPRETGSWWRSRKERRGGDAEKGVSDDPPLEQSTPSLAASTLVEEKATSTQRNEDARTASTSTHEGVPLPRNPISHAVVCTAGDIILPEGIQLTDTERTILAALQDRLRRQQGETSVPLTALSQTNPSGPMDERIAGTSNMPLDSS